jgi:hydroxyethylthiazole kinase-like uncharacterized protein yjeF
VIPVLTAAETRALDRETEARGTSIEALMERAGFAVARAAVRAAGGAYGRRAVVVCGKGNNGGDGLVAARILAGEGMGVDVALLAAPEDLQGPAAANLARLGEVALRARAFEEPWFHRALARAHVTVDAIFGTGFRGAPDGPHAAAIEALNEAGIPVVAVDIPSGVEGDTGVVQGPAVRAAATVSFGAPKVGSLLHPGAAQAGTVEVVDIGFPPDLVRSDLQLVEEADVRSMLPRRSPETHKRRSGVVLVVAGSRRMTGAPRLVADGAYRAGAGLVTVAVPEGILRVVQAGLPEAVFLPLPEGPEGSVAEAGWGVLAEGLERFGAVALGPGLSTDGDTPAFVRRLVSSSSIPVVVDADGINAFVGRVGELGARDAPAVITPHTGELSRLFQVSADDLAADRVGMARKAAAETDAVMVLKGSRSVLASPDGRTRINPTGTSALATGGTGDVLTGAVATMLARGLEPLDAATAATYVHGVAGRIAGDRMGEGATSAAVARALPAALRRLAGAAR